MDKKKRFTLDDYADMIFGITTKKKIPNNYKRLKIDKFFFKCKFTKII